MELIEWIVLGIFILTCLALAFLPGRAMLRRERLGHPEECRCGGTGELLNTISGKLYDCYEQNASPQQKL